MDDGGVIQASHT